MNESSDISILSQNVDKSQVPPIDQKRMVAFINEFIVSTVSFLNEFMTNCETKFVEFELKMQKIEASLLIVEAKMASIPDVQTKVATNEQPEKSILNQPQTSSESAQDQTSAEPSTSTKDIETEVQIEQIEQTEQTQDEHDNPSGVKASDDTRYRKYFKMLQFGVPAPAVKLKIANEGFDPNVLDNPNRILEDGVEFVATEE